MSGESRKPGGLAEFQEAVASLMHVWNDQVATNDDHSPIPVFLDLLSGPNYPLSQAFCWAGWKVVQPIDLQIDRDFDITKSSIQRAIVHILPTCYLVSAAMDCSAKSRIREIALPGLRAPKPLRSEQHPRGLPTLPEDQAQRVDADNKASDFQLAVQHVMHSHGRGAMRENPRHSLHWADPNEVWMHSQGCWHDFEYDSCCFNSVRRKAQTIRHNMLELLALPNLRCAHWHSQDEWKPYVGSDGATIYPSKGLPAVECAGDRRAWTQWDPRTFREFAMGATALSLGLKPEGPEFSDMPIRVHIHDVLLPDKALPADVVYTLPIDLVHPNGRILFGVGTDGTHVDTILQFINH